MSVRVGRRSFLAAAPAGALWAAGCRSTTDAPIDPRKASAEARGIAQVVAAQQTKDGAGVALGRTIGSRALPLLDPFLMLDEIRSDSPGDYLKGFPDHPHRGFETVTIMIDGAMEHRDSVGNHGRLAPGSVQWMTAGRGIIHSEMPKQESGLLWGFQLWVNLPRRLKMTAPRYQDIQRPDVPETSLAGGPTRVLAGSAADIRGPVEGIVVRPTMLDVTFAPGARLELEVAPAHNGFVYLLSGSLDAGPEARRITPRELGVLGTGSTFVATAGGDGARALVVSAEPIGEPIARRGPFVMNTEDELQRAFDDYRAGRLTDG